MSDNNLFGCHIIINESIPNDTVLLLGIPDNPIRTQKDLEEYAIKKCAVMTGLQIQENTNAR